ncbi:MAG: DNA polymerase [Bdellovibrionales bacterium]
MVNYLYMDMNSFFASCEQQENPDLRGKPVAVVPMMADTTFCIAASYQAKKFGVKTGVRVGDAKRMCPGLKLVVAGHANYVRYHHRVKEVLESCVPVDSVQSIDEFCAELTGSQQQVPVATQLVAKIKKAIKEQIGECVTASIGLGPNILLAKMAADMQKPDGLTVIQKTELPQALYSLKPRDVPGIGARMEARLHEKGITTMQQLLSLNEHQMRAVWGGVVGARYHQLLKGEHIPYWFQNEATKSISHQHVLPPKERNPKDALLVLKRLLSKAALRLRRGGFMARRLGVYVKTIEGQRHNQEISFHESQSTSVFFNHLNRMYFHLQVRGRPMKVAVVLSDFIPEQQHQFSLFENDRVNEVFKAVDKINTKYGKDTVYLSSMHQSVKSAPTRIAFSRIPELDEIESVAQKPLAKKLT